MHGLHGHVQVTGATHADEPARFTSIAYTNGRRLSRLPGMEGRLMNVQHLMREPPHIWMQRMKLYGHHIASFLDRAGGDRASPYAHQAALLGMEFAAIIICKSGRM